MINSAALILAFNENNKIKSKNSMDRIRFCWKLTECDDDESLNLHLSFLGKSNKYFHTELKEQFQYRKDKAKVHYFLNNELNNKIDDSLREDIIDVLHIVNYTSLGDYKDWFNDLQVGIRDDEMDFVWSIMKSPFFEYHYELLKQKENIAEDFWYSLRSRFDEHNENGFEFLLAKLNNNEDQDFKGEILYLLAGFKKQRNSKKLLLYARQFAMDENTYTRDRAIIVLGWIGGLKELDILKDRLLKDPNNECRAWASSSFMQMWLRKKSEKLRIFALKSLKEAFQQEKDYFTLSVMLATIIEVENKKFGVSQQSLDKLEKEKIFNAKDKVQKYLAKVV